MLASYLVNKGKKVKILDEGLDPVTPDVLRDEVQGLEKPYVFGISSVTANIARAYELTRMIKDIFPDSFVVMGGIHPTVCPQEAFENSLVDVVVRGQGEIPMNVLYERLKKGEGYADIPSITYRNKEGKIISNPNGPFLKDLNECGLFPFHLFEKNLNRYHLGFIMVTRGCPYECIFCSARSITGRSYLILSPENVIKQLDVYIKEYKQQYLYFMDDIFGMNKKWLKEVCDRMCDAGYYKTTKFSCSLRSDCVDEEVMQWLKRAGFVLINFGIETVTNRLLDLLKKNETVEQHERAIELTKKYGMRVGATFILGLPTETDEEREANYTFAVKTKIDFARFNNAACYPGTELYDIAKKEGRANVGEKWENLNPVSALVESKDPLPYVPLTTTEDVLRKSILRANYRFSIRPKSIFLFLFEGNPLWFSLPHKWYLKPAEYYYIARLGCTIIANNSKKLIRSLSRSVFGG
jgi:radical SAM superfamily enzyme YgiQ (UPF0313 family)